MVVDSSSRFSRHASVRRNWRQSSRRSPRRAPTCERIVHLASYPVDCYELVVRGSDHAALREALVDVAAVSGLDLAVQRAGLHRRAKHLVVMDADSTLLQDEVIDLLAEECGCAAEVSAITELAMSGEIDFAEALRRRVALLGGTARVGARRRAIPTSSDARARERCFALCSASVTSRRWCRADSSRCSRR